MENEKNSYCGCCPCLHPFGWQRSASRMPLASALQQLLFLGSIVLYHVIIQADSR